MMKVKLVLLLLVTLYGGFVAGCGDLGAVSPSSHTATLGIQTAQTFFIETTPSTCCGRLSQWKFYAGTTGSLSALVWRPVSGSTTNFELVGKDDFTASAVGLHTYPPVNTANIEIGDHIGWFTSGTEIVPFSATAGSSTQNQLLATGPTLGAQVPWALTADTANTYAFGAFVIANTAPTVTDATITIATSQTSQTVHVLGVTDVDTTPITGLTSVVCTSGCTGFTLVATATGWDIQSGASLVPGTYTLTVTATDRCDDTGTGTITINVQNAAPVFNPTPMQTLHPVSISDVTTSATSLYTFSVIDSDPITCSVDNTKFEVIYNSPSYELRLKAGSATSLNYDVTPVETVTISCTDSNTAPITSSYTVNIADEPPVLSGMGGTSSAIGDLSAIGTSVHQFTVTDQDDIISCAVDSPEDSVFAISTSSSTGIQTFSITTKAAINYDTATSYTVSVTCTDGQNADVTGSQTIPLVDDPPTLTGLAGSATGVLDGPQTAANLGQFSVADSNDQAIIACTIQAPNDALFDIVTGTTPEFQVWSKAGVSLDAASSPYTLAIDCVDDRVANVVSGTFTVTITNQVPVLVNLPAIIASPISDCTSSDVMIHTFSVTDTEAITCSITALSPYNDDVALMGTSPDFQLWALGTNDFNYNSDSTIQITVTCTDGTTPVTSTFNLTLYDEDPTITGLPAASSYQSLSDTEANTVDLYTFQVSDCVDTIQCAVDPSTPEATSFQVVPGTIPDFTIQYLGRPLAVLDASVSTLVTLTILCDDGASFTSTLTYDVELTDSPPTFVNLPDGSVTISEAMTSRQSIFTVTVSDTTEVTCTLADTVQAAGIHSIEKTNVALPNTEYTVYAHSLQGFDFESSLGYITIDVTCGDSTTIITDTLTVTILNSAPVITNTGGSTTIPESTAGSVDLKTISIATYDASDTTCSITDDDGGPFTMTGNTLQKAAGSLDYETTSTYSIQVTCTDGLLTTTDTFTVNVGNEGPEVTNLPVAGKINEGQVTELLMIELETSEPAEDCNQLAPVVEDFIVKLEPTTNKWSIYYVSQAVAGGPLTETSYDVTVVCSDISDALGTPKTYTINVVDNETPTFTNIPDNNKVELTAKDVSAFDTVFTFTANDAEGDAITYQLLGCDPASTCPFRMTSNGVLTSNSSLASWPVDYYQLIVRVSDRYNPAGQVETVIIHINDINTNPVLTNLPLPDVISFNENNAANDVVYDVNHFDPDENNPDTLTYTCDFTDGGEDYFYCDPSTGEIKAKVAIDYESLTQVMFDVDVKVNDGYNDSTLQTLTIRIDDVNEQPTFDTTFSISKSDEGGPGEEIACPAFRDEITDDDLNDVYTYTMSCPTGGGVFVMDDVTGCVKMTKEWDLDMASKRLGQQTIGCTVTVTDIRGLTDTTTLNIVINEEDDNTPYLDMTSYRYCATVNTTSGSLGVPLVDDNDVLAQHKDFTFELIGSGPGIVDGDGIMTYGDVSGYSKGTSFTQTLRVTDAAGHFSESEVTIMICDPVPVTQTSSSSASSSTSTDTLLAWLIPAILLGLLLLALLGFLLWRYCPGRCACPAKQDAVVTKKITRLASPKSQSSKPRDKPGTIAPVELPISFYYARDRGNLGNPYPMS